MLESKTLNQLTFDSAKMLIEHGNRIESRNGMTYELCDVELFLLDPKNRHLNLVGRQNNIYACVAEMFWILAGENAIDPYLSFFLPRAKDFSDDGKTWQNGYGPKLYNHGNLENVIQSFIKDGPNTRRAVMSIWTPQTDTIQSLQNLHIDVPKDISCNNFIWFWIRDNKLNMKVGVRSNDLIWGLSAINIPEWTFLQELVKEMLVAADERYKDLELGYYHHSVISLHVYDFTAEQAKAIISSEQPALQPMKNYDIKFNIPKVSSLYAVFQSLYNHYCYLIQSGDLNSIEDENEVENIFESRNIPIEENQLYSYAKMIEMYIYGKKNQSLYLDYTMFSEDLLSCIANSKFTPKIVREGLWS